VYPAEHGLIWQRNIKSEGPIFMLVKEGGGHKARDIKIKKLVYAAGRI